MGGVGGVRRVGQVGFELVAKVEFLQLLDALLDALLGLGKFAAHMGRAGGERRERVATKQEAQQESEEDQRARCGASPRFAWQTAERLAPNGGIVRPRGRARCRPQQARWQSLERVHVTAADGACARHRGADAGRLGGDVASCLAGSRRGSCGGCRGRQLRSRAWQGGEGGEDAGRRRDLLCCSTCCCRRSRSASTCTHTCMCTSAPEVLRVTRSTRCTCNLHTARTQAHTYAAAG